MDQEKIQFNTKTGHDNIKNLTCDSCGKVFWSKTDLDIHISTVHESK